MQGWNVCTISTVCIPTGTALLSITKKQSVSSQQ